MRIDLGKYKVFFFDFDGVIVDSLDIKTQAFGELFSKYGKDISGKVMDYHRDNGGVSRYEKFRYYYKELLREEINQNIINRLDKDYSSLVVKKVISAPCIEGALAFIKKLNRLGKDSFVISGTPQKEIRHILKERKMDKLFKQAFGSPLDKTANLKMVLSKYGINAGEAIYFGDAKSDYEAAKKHGISFAGIVNDQKRELYNFTGFEKIENFLAVNLV